ncbi:MAG TPA: Phenylacetic acid catabolic protein [Gemmatimonadota bacterium]|nr:Phenylacetic acid catabolic protein [Gemmatimonadota bacterium]
MSGKTDIKSAADLPEASRQTVRDMILSLADSKRILGILYAYWVLGAPELEANIAASSISQDEWGHSRILYALLKDFGDDPEKLEHSREPAEYQNIEALDARLATWPEFVVANALVDAALTVQLEALSESRFVPLRQRVQKQLEEERFHAAHGAAWLRRLGNAGGPPRGALQDALDARWAAVLHWFGPDDFAAAEVAAGLVSAAGGELRARFLSRAAALLKESKLTVPEVKLDFSSWNPRTRRRSAAGPDPEAVARARGDRNRAFFVE